MKHLKISTNTKTTNQANVRMETHKADGSFSSDDENVPATVMDKSALTDMCNAKDHSQTGNIDLGRKV